LRFLFYGGIAVLPVIAAYTIGVYWVFRGKVRETRNRHRQKPIPQLISTLTRSPIKLFTFRTDHVCAAA